VRAPFVNTAFELTGPRAHTASELAEVLTLVGRRPITHVGSGEAFTARCAEVGAPDVLRVVYEDAAGGWFSKVEDDAFVRLLGRHTTPFAKFAADHAIHFGGGGGD
jgi:hypothetical protein